eukprot:1581413-Ditylum_brightwellii.AAC.1
MMLLYLTENTKMFWQVHQQLRKRRVEKKQLEEKKKKWEAAMKVQQDAENFILLIQTEKNKEVYKDEDIPVLIVPQLKFVYMWKCGKGPSAGTNKPEL